MLRLGGDDVVESVGLQWKGIEADENVLTRIAGIVFLCLRFALQGSNAHLILLKRRESLQLT